MSETEFPHDDDDAFDDEGLDDEEGTFNLGDEDGDDEPDDADEDFD
jgi:hypothetical protein